VHNPIHTIETYLETFDLTQEKFVPFKLFDQQKEAIQNYETQRFNILLKKWKDYFEKMLDENGQIIEGKEHFMDRIMTFAEIVEASYREIELR
jgi:hypothetical protein